MDTVEADAMLRIATTLEIALPLLEKIRDDIQEFTRVQSEAFELMKSREEQINRAMGSATDREMDVL